MKSETVSKKRGRPKAIDDVEMEFARFVFAEAKTTRSLQNGAYALRAMRVLRDTWEDYPNFLPPMDAIKSGIGKDPPWTVLQGIGRLAFDEMITAATIINDRKMTAKEAVKFLKDFRLGERTAKPFSQFELLRILCYAIDGYVESHEYRIPQVITTIASVLEIYSENNESALVRIVAPLLENVSENDNAEGGSLESWHGGHPQ